MDNPTSWNLELDTGSQPTASNAENNLDSSAQSPPKVLSIDAFMARRKALGGPQQSSSSSFSGARLSATTSLTVRESNNHADLDLDDYPQANATSSRMQSGTTGSGNADARASEISRQSKSVLDYVNEPRESEMNAKEYERAVLRELGKRRNEKLRVERKTFKSAKLGDGKYEYDDDARFDDAVADEGVRESIAVEFQRYKARQRAGSVDPPTAHYGNSLFATVAQPGRGPDSSAGSKSDGQGEAFLSSLLGRPVKSNPACHSNYRPQTSNESGVTPTFPEPPKQLPAPDNKSGHNDFRSALCVGGDALAQSRRQAGTNLRRLAAASRDRFAFVTPFARNQYDAPQAAASNEVGNWRSTPTNLNANETVASGGPVRCAMNDEVELTEQERTARELIAKDCRLRAVEPKLVESILAEIMDSTRSVTWAEIAGLRDAKRAVREAIVLPLCNPKLFEAGSIRAPPRGVLLFGPPGNGKTLIGKCVASQVRARFFAISSSTLTSKWVGDGEKLVRALFLVAAALQPAVVFIDEIDALLSKRSDTEHESSRRMKTEFLVQLDGVATSGNERVLVIGATNRPDELDEAARRRFPKRIYVPLPDTESRKQIVERLLSQIAHSIASEQLEQLVQRTDAYSAADLTSLCREAAMYPIRDLASSMCDDDSNADTFKNFNESDVRAVSYSDMLEALARVKPSVSPADLTRYETWNRQFGMLS